MLFLKVPNSSAPGDNKIIVLHDSIQISVAGAAPNLHLQMATSSGNVNFNTLYATQSLAEAAIDSLIASITSIDLTSF